jgi:hypothetical protein
METWQLENWTVSELGFGCMGISANRGPAAAQWAGALTVREINPKEFEA